ncbi:MAG: hypothetical protein IPL83_03650 [Bdellovibrionales bacterium]|nr:hypothetical protein [Bdellovibrionales bacterium]
MSRAFNKFWTFFILVGLFFIFIGSSGTSMGHECRSRLAHGEDRNSTPSPIRYSTAPMLSEFRGENRGYGVEAIDFKLVRYLKTESERERYRIHIVNGRLTTRDGRPLCSFVKCKGAFVMTDEGVIYFRPHHLFSRLIESAPFFRFFKHSSFLAGGDVAAAGYLAIENGVVDYFDNASGHYQLSAKQNLSFLSQLLNSGARPPSRIGFFQKRAFFDPIIMVVETSQLEPIRERYWGQHKIYNDIVTHIQAMFSEFDSSRAPAP